MRVLAAGLVLLLGTAAQGAVPFGHDGTAIIELESGAVVEARALFDSSLSDLPGGVVLKVDYALPGGGEAYLTVDLAAAGISADTPATWTYYEKLTPTVLSFEASLVEGRVAVVDLFERRGETSLHLELSATLTDGPASRSFTVTAITTPAPWVLRSARTGSDGLVVVDRGAGSVAIAGGYSHTHDTIDCTGSSDTVIIDDEPIDWDDEVVYEEEVVIVDDEQAEDVWSDDDWDDDDDDWWEGDYEDEDGWFSADDSDSGFDCGGSDTDSSSDFSASTDGSGPGIDCASDAEAALSNGKPRFRLAPTDRARWVRHRQARRILQLLPMLLLLLALLLLRERAAFTASRRVETASNPRPY